VDHGNPGVTPTLLQSQCMHTDWTDVDMLLYVIDHGGFHFVQTWSKPGLLTTHHFLFNTTLLCISLSNCRLQSSSRHGSGRRVTIRTMCTCLSCRRWKRHVMILMWLLSQGLDTTLTEPLPSMSSKHGRYCL